MKTTNAFNYGLFIIAFGFLMTSCQKENLDLTDIDSDQVDFIVDKDVEIEKDMLSIGYFTKPEKENTDKSADYETKSFEIEQQFPLMIHTEKCDDGNLNMYVYNPEIPDAKFFEHYGYEVVWMDMDENVEVEYGIALSCVCGHYKVEIRKGLEIVASTEANYRACGMTTNKDTAVDLKQNRK